MTSRRYQAHPTDPDERYELAPEPPARRDAALGLFCIVFLAVLAFLAAAWPHVPHG